MCIKLRRVKTKSAKIEINLSVLALSFCLKDYFCNTENRLEMFQSYATLYVKYTADFGFNNLMLCRPSLII